MNKLFISAYIILWSCMIFANTTAISIGPFLVDLKLKERSPEKEVVVKNLPKFFSSGIFNLCSPTSATFLLQKYACDHDEELKNTKCENLEDQKLFSPLSLMSFYKPSSLNDTVSSMSYNKLPLNKNNNEFELGTGPAALQNAKSNGFILYPNSCLPFDQFTNKVALLYQSKQNAQITFFSNLEKLYQKAKNKFISEGKICLECLNENDEDYKNIVSVFPPVDDKLFFSKFKQAILTDTFEKFLYTIFFSKCKKLEGLIPPPKVMLYPENDLEKLEISEVKNKILENINNSKITMLSHLCIDKMDSKDLPKCANQHALVVTGYRNYKINGYNKTYFQIKQTLGSEFDKQYGWVDGDELLKNLAEPNKQGTLMWLDNSTPAEITPTNNLEIIPSNKKIYFNVVKD